MELLNRIRKKVLCETFFLNLFHNSLGNVEWNHTQSAPILFNKSLGIIEWNRGGPRKWYGILNRKDNFEDQGWFYSVIPRDLWNRIKVLWGWFYSVHIMHLVLTMNILSPYNRYRLYMLCSYNNLSPYKRISKNMTPIWTSDSYRFGSVVRDRPAYPLVYT